MMKPRDPMAKFLATLAESEAKTGLAQANHSMAAVVHYFLETGVDPDHIDPLMALWSAIGDLKNGKPSPYLQLPSNLPGRKVHGVDESFQMFVALSVSFFMRSGKFEKKQATEKIHKYLKSKNIHVSQSKLENWHREISNNRRADPKIYRNYKMILESYPSKEQAEAQAKSIMTGLSSMPRLKV